MNNKCLPGNGDAKSYYAIQSSRGRAHSSNAIHNWGHILIQWVSVKHGRWNNNMGRQDNSDTWELYSRHQEKIWLYTIAYSRTSAHTFQLLLAHPTPRGESCDR